MDETRPSSSNEQGLDRDSSEWTDALTSRTIDGDSMNQSPSDLVPDIFSREYLRKLSSADTDEFLSQFKDPSPERSLHQKTSVESLLNKIKSSDDDYFNTHRYGTRPSVRVQKLKDTTNIRKNAHSNANKPDNKCQFHNKINQTIVDLSEELDDDILKLFNRNLLYNSPDSLQDQIIQDQDLDNLINEDELDEAKELVKKNELKELNVQISGQGDQGDPEKTGYDLDSSSPNEIIKLHNSCNQQILDFPADEDSMPVPDADRVKNGLLVSNDSSPEDSREPFKEGLADDVSSLRDVYKVEKLLTKRLRRSGRLEYLVKYENLDDDQACWESEKNLDQGMVEQFNQKYGDRLLLKKLDKQTYSKYFDKRIDESGSYSKHAPHKTEAGVELKKLIESSLANPLCNVFSGAKPERIVGVYQYEGKFYYLVKWEKMIKADLFECAKFKEKWPDVVLNYFQSKIMFCQLQENRKSAELTAKRRVNLHQQPDAQ